MENIFLDTIIAYKEYPIHSITLKHNTPWNKKKETVGTYTIPCSWVYDRNITIRCYHYSDKTRLFIIFSIPKLLRGDNYWYITMNDVDRLVSMVEATVQEHIQFRTSLSLLDFQLSRADLFFMLSVPPELKDLYLDTFDKMGSERYKSFSIGNTRYRAYKIFPEVNTNTKTMRPPSTVFRLYDKDKEVFDRLYPNAVHDDFLRHGGVEYTPPNYLRLELAMLRPTLTRKIDKNVTVRTLLLNPLLQSEILDDYFQTFRLYDRILSAKSFRDAAAEIFENKTYQNVIETARLLRKDRNPNITPNELKYVKQKLRRNGISLITTSKHNLTPIDRNDLFSRNAVFEEVIQ